MLFVNARLLPATTALSAALIAMTTASAQEAQGVYLAQDGLIVAQIESSPVVDEWDFSTSTSGFTGFGYIEWRGDNLFEEPGEEGIFTFNFETDQGGLWNFRIRNRHEDPDPTEENDVWVKMDNGPWIKTFSNQVGSVGAWTWETRFELGGGQFPDASYNLNAGPHTLQFSARSFGFKMDRFHLYRPSVQFPLNVNRPESPRRFGDESCNATSNSTGGASSIAAIGTPIRSFNDLDLEVTGLPNNSLGYFVVSQTAVFVPNAGGSSGNLCIGGSIGRYAGNILNTGSGSVTFPVNLNQVPRPTGPNASVQAGERWYFQLWHRDTGSGGPTSNFSPGLEINFE